MVLLMMLLDGRRDGRREVGVGVGVVVWRDDIPDDGAMADDEGVRGIHSGVGITAAAIAAAIAAAAAAVTRRSDGRQRGR